MNLFLYVVLATIVLFLGCGQSRLKIGGVYETKEAKTPIEGSFYWYKSSRWVLDLSQNGKFRLEEKVLRIPTQDKKYSPVPAMGAGASGNWKLGSKRISLSWTEFVPPEVTDSGRGGQVNLTLELYLQQNGDLVAEYVNASWNIQIKQQSGEFDPDLYLAQADFVSLQELRFVKRR